MAVPFQDGTGDSFDPIASMIPDLTKAPSLRRSTQPTEGPFSGSFWRTGFPKDPPMGTGGTPFLGPGTPEGTAARESIAYEAYSGSASGLPSNDPAARFDEYMKKLAADQAVLDAERNRQVGRSGASAAAPYNRAIAAIEAEMVRLQEQKVTAGQISDRQQAGITGTFEDQRVIAAENAQLEDEAVDRAFGVQTQASKFAIKTSIQAAQVAADLNAMGMSKESVAAMSEGMVVIEEDVMGYGAMKAQNTREYVDAAQKILEQTLTMEEAMRGMDLTFERELLAARIDEQVRGLVQEKAELEAKRAAAVSSARNATLAQFKEGLEPGYEGFLNLNRRQYVQDLISDGKLDIQNIGLYEEMVDLVAASPVWSDTNNLRNINNLKAIFFPENPDQLEGYAAEIYQRLQTAAPDGQATRQLMYSIIGGAEVIDEASNFYQSQIVNSNYQEYQPGSVLSAMSRYEQELREGSIYGVAPWEAWETATSEEAQSYEWQRPHGYTVASEGLGLGGY